MIDVKVIGVAKRYFQVQGVSVGRGYDPAEGFARWLSQPLGCRFPGSLIRSTSSTRRDSMRKIPIATLAGVLAISTVAMAQTTITNGWEIYTGEDSHITCHERPVLLTGSHTDLTL